MVSPISPRRGGITAGPAVGVAADEVDVHLFQIRRGIGAAGEFDRGEVLDVVGQKGFDAVGEGFAGGFIPGGAGYLTGGVAFDAGRRIGDLQPENCLAIGAARGVQPVRLTDADCGRCREKPALGLVGGFGHGVDAVGQVDQRDVVKTGGQPFGMPVQRVMQLEIAAPVAELFRGGFVFGQVHGGQKAAI